MNDPVSINKVRESNEKKSFLHKEATRLVKEQATQISDILQTISGVAPTMQDVILESKELKLIQYLINQMLDPHASIYTKGK